MENSWFYFKNKNYNLNSYFSTATKMIIIIELKIEESWLKSKQAKRNNLSVSSTSSCFLAKINKYK